MRTILGTAFGHSETGMEGRVDWSVHDKNFTYYQELYEGDYMYQRPDDKVFDAADTNRVGSITGINPAIHDENERMLKHVREAPIEDVRDGKILDEAEESDERTRAIYAGLLDKTVVVTWSDGTEEHRLPETLRREMWRYEGLNTIRDGDILTVYDRKRPEEVVWEGEVRFQPVSTREWTQEPIGIEFTFWEGLFIPQSPARLQIAGT